MEERLNRRTLTKTAGALASIAVAGPLVPVAAQEATPVGHAPCPEEGE